MVLNADHVSEMHMQQIAREMNNSETAFIMNHKNSKHGEPELIQISGRARLVFKTEILIGDEL